MDPQVLNSFQGTFGSILLHRWFQYNKELNLPQTLSRAGMKRIALYGANPLAEFIAEELANTDVDVVCLLDVNDKARCALKQPCFNPLAKVDLPDFDMVIAASRIDYKLEVVIRDALEERGKPRPIYFIDSLIVNIQEYREFQTLIAFAAEQKVVLWMCDLTFPLWQIGRAHV